MAIDAPATDDEENRTAVPTAFAITRLDDFLPPCDPDEEGLLKHLTAHMGELPQIPGDYGRRVQQNNHG
ncbi:hypothetical protein A2U01_0101203, partial [Trifolium medium]|nr:hypothetical protein [Trifolium medium]